MINPREFRELIIAPSLKVMDMWSPSAELLMLGTALCESGLTHLVQTNGPALGIMQMEPMTYTDLGIYLKRVPQVQIRASLLAACYFEIMPSPEAMIHNLRFAVLMARIKYWRDPEPLPKVDDIEGLGHYYKRVYNGPGKGSAEKFVEKLRPFI